MFKMSLIFQINFFFNFSPRNAHFGTKFMLGIRTSSVFFFSIFRQNWMKIKPKILRKSTVYSLFLFVERVFTWKNNLTRKVFSWLLHERCSTRENVRRGLGTRKVQHSTSTPLQKKYRQPRRPNCRNGQTPRSHPNFAKLGPDEKMFLHLATRSMAC